MTDNELMRVELLMWKAIAASRDRQIADLNRFFETACEIAHFWRDQAPASVPYPAELRDKIAALAP